MTVLDYNTRNKVNIHGSISNRNKWLNKCGRNDKLSWRKIPNNLCIYSFLEDVEPYLLSPEAWALFSDLLPETTVWKEEREVALQMGTLQTLVIHANISSDKSCWRKRPLCSILHQNSKPSPTGKPPGTPKLKHSLQNIWWIVLKVVQATKNSRRLRTCHSQEKGELNVLYSGWDSGAKTGH